MLFDLRGSGRRRVVKVVYVTLALLMGGGLVLFGIGGDVSGGLVDAITERSGSTDDTTKRLEERERAATRRAQADPENPELWAAVARARFNLAGVGDNLDQATGQYTATGQRWLRSAGDAWQRHLDVADQPDDRVASLMVQAFGALNQPAKAATAQEVITDARPTASTFSQLAIFAYQAGQTRKGDLAKNKALELTDPDMREALKGQLETAKQQAAGASAAAEPSATP